MNYCYYVCTICLMCGEVDKTNNVNYMYLHNLAIQFEPRCDNCQYDTLNDKPECVQNLYQDILNYPGIYPLVDDMKPESLFGFPYYFEHNFRETQCPTVHRVLDDDSIN